MGRVGQRRHAGGPSRPLGRAGLARLQAAVRFVVRAGLVELAKDIGAMMITGGWLGIRVPGPRPPAPPGAPPPSWGVPPRAPPARRGGGGGVAGGAGGARG